MPPYRVKLARSFNEQLETWDLPTDIIRTLCESLTDILGFQSAWKRLRPVPAGLALELEVRSYTFLLLVHHRDETFFVVSGSFTQDK